MSESCERMEERVAKMLMSGFLVVLDLSSKVWKPVDNFIVALVVEFVTQLHDHRSATAFIYNACGNSEHIPYAFHLAPRTLLNLETIFCRELFYLDCFSFLSTGVFFKR